MFLEQLLPKTHPVPCQHTFSKLVQIQMQQYISKETPNAIAVSMHPGIVDTNISRKEPIIRFAKDTFALAGGAAVWLATENARFMNGRYMSANWSVTELEELKDRIVEKNKLVMQLAGAFGTWGRLLES